MDEKITKVEEKPINKTGVEPVETMTAPEPVDKLWQVIVYGAFPMKVKARSKDYAEGVVLGKMDALFQQTGFVKTKLEVKEVTE